MAYLVLARRYRPSTFAELVGQDHIVTILSNAITSSRVHHAFLFTGARGTGKTTTARILAKSINCVNGPTVTPCNACSHCLDIAACKDVDVLEIDGATNTGVDSVRALREDIRYLPASGKYRIVIIDEVHMLTTSAFNALLKTLEEPPPHVIFILATTEPHKIPATILSRVQRFDFHRVDADVLTNYLMGLLQSEGFSAKRDALRIIALEGEGSVRDSLSLLDQVLAHHIEGEITAEEVSRVLGLSDRRALLQMAFALLSRNGQEVFDLLQTIFRDGHDLVHFTKSLAGCLRDLALCRLAEDPLKFLPLTPAEITEITEKTRSHTPEHITHLFSRVFFGIDQVARAPSARMALEMVLCEILLAEPLAPLSDLFSRLENLETRNPGSFQATQAVLSPKPQKGRSRDSSPHTTAQENPAFDRKSPPADPASPPATTSTIPVAETMPQTVDNPAVSPSAPDGFDLQAWLAFLAVIRPAFPTLSMLLDDGKFCGARVLDGVWDIQLWFEKGRHDFNVQRLRDNLSILNEQLSIQLGSARVVLLHSDKPPSLSQTSHPVQGIGLGSSAREMRERKVAREQLRSREHMNQHPFIRQLVDKLHGEITEFRDLSLD